MNQTSPGSEENNEGQGKLPSGRITAQHGARRPRNIKGRSFKSSSPPKVKINRKQNKGDRPKVPKIDAPLSELTKGYTNIPVRNMEEWVHRPAVTREKEVEKRNGYVTRPMNSFMLYRSAYAERTKMWCLQNNHQVVSSVSGESWPMEPPEIREQYNEYAQIERENHQKAHPGYKFSPSKAQNLPRKRKGIADDSAGEFTSGQDNQDLDWKPPGKKRAKWKLSETQSHGAGYPVSSLLQSQLEYALPFNEPVLNRSTFHATNPGKPLPAPIDNLDMLDQYYEATVHASRSGDYIEDVRYRKTPRPYTQSRSMPPLVGLPGAHHYELLDQEPFGGPVMADLRQIDCQIDPTLSRYTDQTQSFISEQQFREYNDDVLFDAGPGSFEHYNPSDQYDPQSLVWTYGDSKQADVNDDFVKWMEETNDR